MSGFHDLKDLQLEFDSRKETIQKVGIKNLKYPIKLKDEKDEIFNTIGTFCISVNLKSNVRGIHMSRFIEVLNNNDLFISYEKIFDLVKQIRCSLGSENAFMKIKFPYFLKKQAPVSRKISFLNYNISYLAKILEKKYICELILKIPVMTSCPCSKAISNYGAHNQRSLITINCRIEKNENIKEIIKTIEKVASSELFSLLKKEDEKYVTETSYNNSKFVEDIIRDISISIKKELGIKKYKIYSENMESIHNHNVFGYIVRK